MSTPVITAAGVRRSYRGTGTSYEAVRGVDLAIEQGELFALLGTNGAGKTSLLEVMEGLAPATAGVVRVFGLDPYRHRDRVRPFTGIMLQEAGFPGDIRTGEMVKTWAATQSRRSDDDVLDAVGLSHRSGVAVSSLSGGERRRLDLALALLGRPQLLFLDEPTTGLDPQSRRDAWSIVKDRLESGVTVVLTTHYLDEAETLADRLAIMHAGVIVREGTIDQIVADEPGLIDVTATTEVALPPLFGTVSRTASPSGTRLQISTHQVQQDLAALLRWADQHTITLLDIDARTASLEQAFLRIANDQNVASPATAA